MPTLDQAISEIRRLLDAPQVQRPAPERVAREVMAEYQQATNQLGNTANAWNVATQVLNLQEGKTKYALNITDFGKALSVASVPDSPTDAQYTLTFTEIEHLPKEWNWLTDKNGYLWGSNRGSEFIAFYRTIASGGETVWAEVKPAPRTAQKFEILYTVGDWSRHLNLRINLPQAAHQHYFFALCALNLLEYAAWSGDEAIDAQKREGLRLSLTQKVVRYQKTWDEYCTSLHHSDVVFADEWYFD